MYVCMYVCSERKQLRSDRKEQERILTRVKTLVYVNASECRTHAKVTEA